MALPTFIGIVNLTQDSFSDGCRFLDPTAAIAHGESLIADGAHWLDLGAESSNPLGSKVSEQDEIARLNPVISHLVNQGIRVSVDTYKPIVMQHVLDLGVQMINDITALSNPAAVEVLLRYPKVSIVLMFARNTSARAEIKPQPYHDLIQEIVSFFQHRIEQLVTAGIQRERLILDPGMGFFLGSNPEPSLWTLKHLQQLHSLQLPLYVCTSRKSFLGTVTQRTVHERQAATLASELWAISQGVQYIRTHDVKPLRDASTIWHAIDTVT